MVSIKKNNFFNKLSGKIGTKFSKSRFSSLNQFVSKFAKAILTMIAVLPAGGLLITIGKVIGSNGLAKIQSVSKVFNQIGIIIESIGWIPFTHMGLLFAIAIGGSWSKDRSGGAFAAALAYLVLLTVGASFFVFRDTKMGQKEFFNYILGKWSNSNAYFTLQQGVNSLRFDALGGIIMGFLGATIYNRFYIFNKLPKILAFFNGARFVPFMVFIIITPLAVVISLFWPLLQTGINQIGNLIAKNNKIPFIMPFSFGFLERLLLPFGLHHLLTIPMNYTSFGGQLDYLDLDQFKGSFIANKELKNFFQWVVDNKILKLEVLKAEGQEKMWFTWITALGAVKNHWVTYAEEMGIEISVQNAYQDIMNSFQPVRFKVGQMITSTGSLVGASLGMLWAIQKNKRIDNKSIYISAALACLLTGVTEPVEFIFLFVAPILYLIHAFLTGIAFGLADFIPMRIHGFGGVEIILKYFLVLGPTTLIAKDIKSNLWLDGIWLLLVCLLFATIYFFVFKYGVRGLKPMIPGINRNLTNDENKKEQKSDTNEIVTTIIRLLGGDNNIIEVDACMTRLRVIVKDKTLVVQEFQKLTGATGVVQKNESIQIIYGGQANIIKEKIKDELKIYDEK